MESNLVYRCQNNKHYHTPPLPPKTPGTCHALASTTSLARRLEGFTINHSNSCGDDFFLHWALGHCLDIQDSQRVFHLSYFFVLLHHFIANHHIKQIATSHQLKQILILNTPAMLYNQMRQMQMLLFARFGVSPTQSLALASLTTHPVLVENGTRLQETQPCCRCPKILCA